MPSTARTLQRLARLPLRLTLLCVRVALIGSASVVLLLFVAQLWLRHLGRRTA